MPKKAVDVLRKPFPQDKAVYSTRKKPVQEFFSKKRKKVCAKFPEKFAQNFHVWHKSCLDDYPALQEGNNFIIFILIYDTHWT